ncbi:MAG: N-acetyltransferase [Desulfurellaceae bacterium]|nr:N-acetyltransferase [Desulfurellaceae bacterium]
MAGLLRLATEDDAEGMLEIYAQVVEETVISFEEQPPSPQEFRSRIRTVLDRLPWLVCVFGDDLAGYAYATPFRSRAGYRWSVELTVYVHPNYHRRGVARSLYTALLRCLEAQGYHTAVALIALPNQASTALHAAMGFRRTGVLESIGYKHGRWINDDVWQLTIQPAPGAPSEPIPLSQFIGTREWQEALDSGTALLKT